MYNINTFFMVKNEEVDDGHRCNELEQVCHINLFSWFLTDIWPNKYVNSFDKCEEVKIKCISSAAF